MRSLFKLLEILYLVAESFVKNGRIKSELRLKINCKLWELVCA